MDNKAQKPTLLIVDDEISNSKILVELLRSDYVIRVANNGERALQIAQSESPPDLIMLDVMMPGMDGYEVCQKLKSNPSTSKIPVIFITAKTDEMDEIHAFEMGAVDYVTKPFRPVVVKARVKTHVELKIKTAMLVNQNMVMTQDLKTAASVQARMFTQYQLPDFLDVAVRYIPYSHVSGDLYKLYSDHPSQLKIFMGDGTGHGVAAALITIMADTLLTQQSHAAPQKVMNYINDDLQLHLPDDRFMSGVLLNIQQDGRMTLANAGHPAVIVLPARGGEPELFRSGSTMLGILPQPHFNCSESSYLLEPGDIGILYTDGLSERYNAKGELFGEDRIKQFLKQNMEGKLDILLAQLLEQLEAFAEGCATFDDTTVLLFRYKGAPQNSI
ncbi:MAG: SpoIIE family protein phosphatase [SAR324 cluster bacterium]|nr:SpoIIE family protein phosphatase [SAR324 cluster bacterium]